MSTEYPLDPFTDFAAKLDFELDEDNASSWGELKPERREKAVPAAGNYVGVGEDNPYAT